MSSRGAKSRNYKMAENGPKMDLTNCRTMEIFRMLGIADEYRAQEGAVGGDYKCDSLFYTSCSPGGKLMAAWVSSGVFL